MAYTYYTYMDIDYDLAKCLWGFTAEGSIVVNVLELIAASGLLTSKTSVVLVLGC